MSFQPTRADNYKIQQEGYETFVPMPLPPIQPLELSNKLLQLLLNTDIAIT